MFYCPKCDPAAGKPDRGPVPSGAFCRDHGICETCGRTHDPRGTLCADQPPRLDGDSPWYVPMGVVIQAVPPHTRG